jgi:hypothetical protein
LVQPYLPKQYGYNLRNENKSIHHFPEQVLFVIVLSLSLSDYGIPLLMLTLLFFGVNIYIYIYVCVCLESNKTNLMYYT